MNGKVLKDIIKSTGVEQTEVAKKLGLTPQGLNSKLNAASVKTDFLQKVGIAINKTVEQIMQDAVALEANGVPKKQTGRDIAAQKAFGGRQQRGILAVPVKAQAGYARMLGDDFAILMDQLERIAIPNFPYDGEEFRAFEVEGDSMEYVNEQGHIAGIPSGMWVVGQRVPQEDWAENLARFRIHVIVFARQILIKRILQDNSTEIILHSDNDLYPQERRALEDVKEIWYVVRKLDWDMPPPRRIEINV